MPYYLFHYTYGVEYTKEGIPVELQVGRVGVGLWLGLGLGLGLGLV